MKVEDLVIGKIYIHQGAFGDNHVRYMRIITGPLYKGEHQFDSVSTIGGAICTDEQVETLIQEEKETKSWKLKT